MDLAKEMRMRNIERNVHTYTALMNVCIKCGNCPLALDTYNHMRQDGAAPNVVTYNTLIECVSAGQISLAQCKMIPGAWASCFAPYKMQVLWVCVWCCD